MNKFNFILYAIFVLSIIGFSVAVVVALLWGITFMYCDNSDGALICLLIGFGCFIPAFAGVRILDDLGL